MSQRAAFIANTDSLYLLTQRGSLKRMAVADIPVTSRANRGLQVLRELRPSHIVSLRLDQSFGETVDSDLFTTEAEAREEQILQVLSNKGTAYEINLADLSLSERTRSHGMAHPVKQSASD